MTTSNKNIRASNNRFSNLLDNKNSTKNNITPPVIQKQTNNNLKVFTHLKNSMVSPLNYSTKLPVAILNDAHNERPILNLHGYKSDREEIKQNNILRGGRNYEDRIKDERIRRSLLIEERMRKSKEDEIKMLSNIDSFPELKPVKISESKYDVVMDPIKKKMDLNYVSKIINNNQDCSRNEFELNNDDYVKPGCVCIKTDNITNQLLWTYGEDTINNDDEMEEYEDPIVVFSRLTEMWDNRRMDYIRKWGIADYERNFMLEYIEN